MIVPTNLLKFFFPSPLVLDLLGLEVLVLKRKVSSLGNNFQLDVEIPSGQFCSPQVVESACF